ncbi:TIGR01459 family HAD-type hydrolase [Hyphomicrobium sp.]|uniref:TIGR01459 family HAD-type hydrolase n=1 Tax=Hyphomicrobium sp. TaxID=82 RepID=UPI0025C0B5DB|nr:TIGR01459 family HAD-type hydrolase [Hyphomicrobium sp.]MCC7250717.1 TIGR01459 family HAD-type hydrolase [Hyphomicrobium sp.]
MEPPAALQPIPILTSISGLAPARDVWLTDVWGVIHNGVEPFAAACEACTRFRLAGGTVILLSNAPRPAASVAAQLDRIGVPRFAWDAILTSGDAARSLVGAFAGKRVFHLGPERDLSLYDGLDVTLAEPTDADAVSCTGLFDDEIETPADYAELLATLAERKLPMVCANPDLTVERGSKIVYCAGALAADYEVKGGSVAYAGKPYLPIYEMAFALIQELKQKPVAKDRILCIGDGIRTDIKGAAAAGLASVFIASGVHVAARLTSDVLNDLFPTPDIRPIAALPALAW